MPKAEQLHQKREAAREVIDVLQEIAALLVVTNFLAEVNLC